MSRNPALFGFGQYPNLIGKSSCLVSVPVTYEAAALKAIRTQTDEPSEVSRILTTNPEFTYWNANFQTILRTVSGMAGVNSNLSPNGYYRFLAGTEGVVAPAFQYDTATSIEISSNITGTLTDIDEAISAPDANFILPTNVAAKWSARFAFNTPSPTPTVGAYMAAFVARVLRVAGGDTTFYPRFTAELYESGSLVRVLGSRAVSVATGDGQLLIFPFNPSELAAPNLSNVEARISCTAGAGTGSQYAKLNTLALLTDVTGVPSASYPFDSGWIPSPALYYSGESDDPVPQLSFDYFPESPWTDISNLMLLVMDDQAVANPNGTSDSNSIPIGLIPSAPSGAMDLGVFVAGPALVLERGPQQGPQSSVIIEGYEGVTEGGQTYGSDAFRRRSMTVNLTLNRTEKDALMDGIDWRRGRSGAIYVNLDPNLDEQHREFTAGWVTVVEAGAAIQMPAAYDAGDLMLFTKQVTMEERL